jgi:uncharacterized protein YjbI with pentapeptide repeats
MAPASDTPRPLLTNDERRLLTDSVAFAEAAAKGPVILNDRTVEGVEIRDMVFSAIRWTGVDFRRTTFSAISFASAELREVTFTNCNLDNVTVENSRLDQCTFDFAEIKRMRISDSTTAKLALSACTCKDMVFERSEFESAVDRASTFTRARFSDMRWKTPEWRGTHFDKVHVENATIAGGMLAGVTFTDALGRSLLVQGTLVDGLDFVLGSWTALTFEGIRGRTLRLTEVGVTGLSLLACGELVGVAIAGGNVAGLAIDRCPTLGLVSFGQVPIQSLMVSDSFIDGAYWQGCTITDDNSIERSCLAGLTLTRSKIAQLAIRDTQFTVALRLEGAHIEGLKLERISYAPDLDLRTDGLSYGPGARFPTRTP